MKYSEDNQDNNSNGSMFQYFLLLFLFVVVLFSTNNESAFKMYVVSIRPRGCMDLPKLTMLN